MKLLRATCDEVTESDEFAESDEVAESDLR
jgi:hypothetical protein